MDTPFMNMDEQELTQEHFNVDESLSRFREMIVCSAPNERRKSVAEILRSDSRILGKFYYVMDENYSAYLRRQTGWTAQSMKKAWIGTFVIAQIGIFIWGKTRRIFHN
jgi:hypothetical protein